MATQKLTVGDSVGLRCTLYRAKTIVPINSSSTIRVAVTNMRSTVSFTGSVTLDINDSSHALGSGVVWAYIPAALTQDMIPGDAILEIEVNDPTEVPGNQQSTWKLKVKVQASTIN